MSSRADNGRYWLTFAALALAGIAFSLLQSVVAPALPEIQREMDISTTSASWIYTAYLLSAAVCTPVIGRLGDMYGKERMLLITLVILGLGSAISAVATSIDVLLVGRVVTGAGGAIFPLSFGIIRDEFPRDRVMQGIAVISGLLAIGGGLGILLAGPIVDTLSYHWIFWIPLIMVLVATVGTVLYVPESPIRVPGRINWPGALLLTAWLVCLLLGVSKGETWGWGDARTLGLFAAAVVLLLAWIRVEDRAAEPLIDMNMMRLHAVWPANLAAFLVGVGIFVCFLLLPQFVSAPESTGYGFGASVTESGLFLLPFVLLQLFVGPVTGRLASRFGARLPVIVGSLIMTGAFLLLAFVHSEPWEVYVTSGILGLGTGLAFSSLANLIVEGVRPEEMGQATGMNAVLRIIGGSVGSTLGASILAGSVVAATGLPSESGFTAAFLLGAGACALAALAGVAAPKPAGVAAPATA